jgi:hypothetical protein
MDTSSLPLPPAWVFAAAASAVLAYATACSSDSSPDQGPANAGNDGPPQGPSGPSSEDPIARDAGPVEDLGPGGPPQMLFVGRFDTSDPAGPKASWPGSRIVTRFRGTAVSVKLSESIEDWMDGGPSYWDVSIDRAPPKAIAMIPDNQAHVFDLATDLPPGDHEVELYKRSEMQTGVTQFLGFDFHGGRSLEPPPRQPRHIEAMADSYGTGYGIETLNAPNLECTPPPNHAGRHQNFRKAWPALLGIRFGADVEGTVYSGKGLTRGIWPTDDDGLIDYYNRANPNPALARSNPPLFDLKSWIPDVIVLVQGTVDNGLGDFRTVYRDFVVNQLRARAPEAHIFLVVPGAVARAKWIDTVNSVAAERNAAGDLKVYPVIPGEEEPEEMTACGYHGAPAYHQRIANEIGAVIAQKTGW